MLSHAVMIKDPQVNQTQDTQTHTIAIFKKKIEKGGGVMRASITMKAKRGDHQGTTEAGRKPKCLSGKLLDKKCRLKAKNWWKKGGIFIDRERERKVV